MFKVTGTSTDPLLVTLTVNLMDLQMEVDTRASVSIISDKTYHSAWPDSGRPPLHPSRAKLCTYTGEALEVLGALSVAVTYKEQHKNLSLLVVQGDWLSLLGRD